MAEAFLILLGGEGDAKGSATLDFCQVAALWLTVTFVSEVEALVAVQVWSSELPVRRR